MMTRLSFIAVAAAVAVLLNSASGKPSISSMSDGLHINTSEPDSAIYFSGVDVLKELSFLRAQVLQLKATAEATIAPSPAPTATLATPAPTSQPTVSPTENPTDAPTKTPTDAPTDSPTKSPTNPPTKSPTDTPTKSPTDTPTKSPTLPSFCPADPIGTRQTVSTSSDQVISCSTSNACNSQLIQASTSQHLRVTCSFQSSCRNMRIILAAGSRLTLTCSGISSCQGATITATGSTDITVHGNNQNAAGEIDIVASSSRITINCDTTLSCSTLTITGRFNIITQTCSGHSSCPGTTLEEFHLSTLQLSCSGTTACNGYTLDNTVGGSLTASVSTPGSSGMASRTYCTNTLCYPDVC